jgi:hypothetical protein
MNPITRLKSLQFFSHINERRQKGASNKNQKGTTGNLRQAMVDRRARLPCGDGLVRASP